MRTVIEKEQARLNSDVINTSLIPPIQVHWDCNEESCLIQVIDQGAGIPDEILNNVFLFHYTTAKPPTDEVNVMAGYGYGLPLSRIYARFLKGDIWLDTKFGQGTTCNIKLKTNWQPDELI